MQTSYLTSGPGVPTFSRFKDAWDKIKDKPYCSGIEDDVVAVKIPVQVQTDIKTFCLAELKVQQHRADYKEFLQTVLLFLGEDMPDYHFCPPGAISHARWMAKGIYNIKIFLFRKHFHLTKKELDGLRGVCIFIVKAWYNCTRAIEAPNQDLNFLKAGANYFDPIESQKLVAKFCGHLWYLSDEAVAFALFDSNVALDTKRKMAKAIRAFELDKEEYEDELFDEEQEKDVSCDENSADEESENEESEDAGNDGHTRSQQVISYKGVKIIRLTAKQVDEEIIEKDLSHFVTCETANFFKRFGLSTDCIYTEPETWTERKDYQQAQEIVRDLHVVNDAAERGVKLMEDYNNVLCRSEKQKQFILQVVSANRKAYPLHEKNKLI